MFGAADSMRKAINMLHGDPITKVSIAGENVVFEMSGRYRFSEVKPIIFDWLTRHGIHCEAKFVLDIEGIFKKVVDNPEESFTIELADKEAFILLKMGYEQ